MEIKKTKKADLQNKKTLFFQIGLIIALLIIIIAFNWKSEAKKETVFDLGPSVVIEEESVPITQEEQPKPQEIPKVPVVTEDFSIANNDIKVDLDMSAFNTEDNNLGVTPMEYVKEKEKPKQEEEKEEVIPFAVVEEKPTFLGEDPKYKFPAWVQSKISYPEAAAENNIQGTVYITFTIMPDGSLSNIKVLRPVDPLLDAEALRGVKMSPKWKPGKQRNKAVTVSYNVPIVFKLAN